MTFEQWKEKYKPNQLGTDIIVYGFSFVEKKPKNHIWTVIDEGEGVCIVTGFHFVNRLGYIFTNNTWENSREDDIILTEEEEFELVF